MKDFTIISSLPTCYIERFCCFNECKMKIEISHRQFYTTTIMTKGCYAVKVYH